MAKLTLEQKIAKTVTEKIEMSKALARSTAWQAECDKNAVTSAKRSLKTATACLKDRHAANIAAAKFNAAISASDILTLAKGQAAMKMVAMLAAELAETATETANAAPSKGNKSATTTETASVPS